MKAFFEWFRNVWFAVTTVLQGMWITLRTMTKTYERKAFAEIYEYPEASDGTPRMPAPKAIEEPELV